MKLSREVIKGELRMEWNPAEDREEVRIAFYSTSGDLIFGTHASHREIKRLRKVRAGTFVTQVIVAYYSFITSLERLLSPTKEQPNEQDTAKRKKKVGLFG